MRRCFNEDFPKREETDAAGRVVRVVSLRSVECPAIPVIRSTIVWPNGEKQHTYACADHIEKLRKIVTDADFPWSPAPYAPKRKSA